MPAGRPTPKPKPPSTRPSFLRQLDLDHLARIGISVVLVETPRRQLEERALRIGPKLGLGLVQMTAQHHVHPLCQQAPHLRGVGQLVERMVDQDHPEPWQRIAVLVRRQPHHLGIGEAKVLGVGVVAAEPGRIEADHVDRERQARKAQALAIPERMEAARHQRRPAEIAANPGAVSGLPGEKLFPLAFPKAEWRLAACEPGPDDLRLGLPQMLSEKSPGPLLDRAVDIVIPGNQEQAIPRDPQPLESRRQELPGARELARPPRERGIPCKADQIEGPGSRQHLQIGLPRRPQDPPAAPGISLLRTGMEVRQVEEAKGEAIGQGRSPAVFEMADSSRFYRSHGDRRQQEKSGAGGASARGPRALWYSRKDGAPMQSSLLDSLTRKALEELCTRYGIQEMALFGSALTDDFRETSDVDFLVTFKPEARPGFLTLTRLQRELEARLGRRVDIVPRQGLKPLIRDAVLASARVLYAA